MQNIKENYSLEDIIKPIKFFFAYLKKKWWMLLLAVFAGAGLGVIYYKIQKPKYEAVCTFILEEKQSGMGGLSSIASQFGFDVGGLSGAGSILAGDNILDILKSRNIIQRVLLSKVDSSQGTDSETLADLFLESNKWKKKWSDEEELKNISFSNLKPSDTLTLTQSKVLHLIHEYLIKKSILVDRLNKKGTIIKVAIEGTNPVFAKLMTDRIIDESKSFYITIKTNTAQKNVNRLERISDSLLALLNNKTYEAAGAVVLDANPALKSIHVPSELKMRDKTVIGGLYSEVTKNLELSRISLSQQTPVIQILDKPYFPLIDKRKGIFFLVVIATIVSLLFITLALGINFILSNRHFSNPS